jgi:hypothetical protein
MTKKNAATVAQDDEEPDTLVPDPEVCKEFGGVTLMCLWRWSRDPTLNFPSPIKLHGRNYRSRRMLEAFKQRMIERALRTRSKKTREA